MLAATKRTAATLAILLAAAAAAPVARPVPVAARRAHVPRSFEPGAAAQHTLLAISCRPRRAIARRPRIRTIPAVGHPLLDVTVHVVKTEGIGRKTADGNRLLLVDVLAAAAIGVIAVVVRLVGADRRTEVKRRRRARARRVLPLGLA